MSAPTRPKAISLEWAAGVFDSSVKLRLRRAPNGDIRSVHVSALVPRDVGYALHRLFGGTYLAGVWYLTAKHQEKALQAVAPYMLDECQRTLVRAIVAFRLTAGAGFKTGVSAAVRRFRRQAALRSKHEGTDTI